MHKPALVAALVTDVNVRTTDGSVDLSGTVPSLEAREHAIKLAWKAARTLDLGGVIGGSKKLAFRGTF